MRIILFFAVTIFSVQSLSAQKFFYIDSAAIGSFFIKTDLIKNHQFIAKSVIESDCLIKTETITTPIHTTIVKITMQDSTTLKTILEVSEEYSYETRHVASDFLKGGYLINLYVNYSHEFIYWAKRNTVNTLWLLLKEKKDKT